VRASLFSSVLGINRALAGSLVLRGVILFETAGGAAFVNEFRF
jgi:hypothetical protein